MTRRTVFCFALAMISAVGCGTAPDCASRMWPRLIIGVITPAGPAPDATALVRMRARLADGTVLEGNPEGCPEIADVICSFSFFTAPRDRFVTLIVEPSAAGRRAVESRIELGEFSYTGRDMTYVVVTLPAGGSPQIGAPRLVQGCRD